MSNCSLLHIYRILVVILVVSLTEHESYGDYVTALNTVPAADKSIKRFPEPGSKYDGVLKDFRGVAYNSNVTEMVVVGADGYMFRLDLKTFSIQNTSYTQNIIQVVPDKKTMATCIRYNGRSDCPNTMMGVVYNGSSEIFACGTYAKNARCWMFSIVTLQMTRIVKGLYRDILKENEFCPKYEYGNLMPIAAENGVIFGATDSLQNPDKHSIRALFPNGEMIRSAKPKRHFKEPIFAWVYNGEDGFVYFFFYEIADEVAEISGRPKTRYSRVGRICSYDKGPYIHSSELFMSYSKSQIVCYKTENGVTDYYDHIQSATAVKMHDSTGKPETYIYAVFTTTLRSTGSSAICRYKFSDMTKVFQTSKYCLRKMGVNDCTKLANADDEKVNVARMKCDANLDTWAYRGWDPIWVNEYPLLNDDIQSADKTTVVTFRGERVTAIAVDDLHNDVNKTDVGIHVIFAATEEGKMFKVMMNSTNKGVPVFVEVIQAVKGSGAITRLQLYDNYVIATGRHVPLMKIAKERCESKFLSCSDCVKARDPYCAWSLRQNKCTRAANLTQSERIQDIAVGRDLNCPRAPGTATTSRPTIISTVKNDTPKSVATTKSPNVITTTTSRPTIISTMKNDATESVATTTSPNVITTTTSRPTLISTGKNDTTESVATTTSPNVTGTTSGPTLISTVKNDTTESVATTTSSNVTDTTSGPTIISTGKNDTTESAATTTSPNGVTTKSNVTITQQQNVTELMTTETPIETTSKSKVTFTAQPNITKSMTKETAIGPTSKSNMTESRTKQPPTEKTSKYATKSTTNKEIKKLITTEKFVKRKRTKKSTKIPTTQRAPTTLGQRCANPEQKYKETDKYFVPFIVCLIILILGVFAVIFNYCVGRMRSEKVNYSNRELGGRKGTLDITARKAATIFKTRTKSDATKTGKPLALQDRENSRHLLVDGQADNMGFTTGIDVQANTTEA